MAKAWNTEMTSETEVQRLQRSMGVPMAVAVARRYLFPHWGMWLVPASLAGLNLAWIALDPRLSLAQGSIVTMLFVGVGTPLALAYRALRGRGFDPVLEALFRMLMVALFAGLFTQQLNLFSHLMMTLKLPLADGLLHGWDEALGFDWNAYAQLLGATWWSRMVLQIAYSNMIPPAIGAILVGAIWTGRYDRVEELAFLVLASGFICVGIAGLLPAEDAWYFVASPQTQALLGGQPGLEWMDQFKALRGEQPVAFNLGSMGGLATFPSFHACLAITIIWCSRGRWYTALPGAAAGLVILAATPVYGGHYGVDVLGGAVVMAGLILLWRRRGPVLPSGRV